MEFDRNRAIRRTIFSHRTFDVVVCSLKLHDIVMMTPERVKFP